MRRLLLFDETYIKENSLIELNVDTKTLQSTIVQTQENDLKDVLGITLYTSIIESVYNKVRNSTPLSTVYKTLLEDYIFPYLVHKTIANFIITNHYKVTNKGLVRLTDNNATSLNNDELEYFKDVYDNYSGSYKKALIDYLKANQLTTSTDEIDTDVLSDSIGWFLETDNGYFGGVTVTPSVTGFSGTFSNGINVITVNNGVIVGVQ